jgi:hypothetical protein
MKFLMLVQRDPEPDPDRPGSDDAANWADEATASGARLDGDRLRPPEEAKTVRVRGDRVLVTDGPFAETNEVILGYDVLQCEDLDEAIELAARHPMARLGRLQLRAVWPFEDDETATVP